MAHFLVGIPKSLKFTKPVNVVCYSVNELQNVILWKMNYFTICVIRAISTKGRFGLDWAGLAKTAVLSQDIMAHSTCYPYG